MDEILTALAEQHAELGELLASLNEQQWAQATPCEGWTVADVVVHLAQTDELAIGSVDRRFDATITELAGDIGLADSVDAGADLMVARDREQPIRAIHDRWRHDADTLRARFAAADLHERVTWVAGELSVRTLATTRLAECWIHTGDVATAVGVVQVPGNRLRHVARLAWRTLPYAFAQAGRGAPGPVAFELTGPDGDEWSFRPEEPAPTVIRGSGVELCLVAARPVEPRDTTLRGTGPDADAVLELVRTYA